MIDVTFCSKWVTTGTNYGNRGTEKLTPAAQLPGVNAAYRKSVLDEVGGFDKGAIGCEDAMMDYRIEKAGHKLWQDRDAIMWHRRRNPSRGRSQIMKYCMLKSGNYVSIILLAIKMYQQVFIIRNYVYC